MQPTSRRATRLLAFIAISVLVLSVGIAQAAVPTITSLSPSQGPIKGGNTVVINGMGFTGATAVSFGITPATSFTVNSDLKITAVAPARPIGMVSVRVTTPEGTSAVGAASNYTFNGPMISSMSPASSAPAGGVTVTITGTRFTKASAVKFGATAATSFVVNSATQITATAPARPSGTIDVRITTPEGTSRTSTGSKFTYLGPIVDLVAPAQGPMGGGTTVTITGTGFSGATAVKFGATAASSFTINSDAQITAVSPARPVGTIDVRVTTPIGTSADAGLNTKFTYLGPSVTKISPTTGPVAGGTRVTITGTRLTGATAVLFGPTAATFTVVNGTTITATAPRRPLGGVHVRVQTPEGISRTGAVDVYTYQ